jgi:penicillin amidase
MIKLFDGWDGRASADSRVLPLAAAMRRAFADKVFEAALGAERAKAYSWPNRDTVIDTLVTARPVEWLPKEYSTYADFLLACWNDARTELAGSAGADDTQWTWGRVVPPIRFSHPLEQLPGAGSRFAIAPLPEFTDGSGETVNAGVYVSMRFIADLSDWDRSRQGIALGESGDPSSPHWADQLSSWRAVKTPTFPFSSAAVARATVQTLILAPAHPPAKSP